jgi:hypothetical protein
MRIVVQYIPYFKLYFAYYSEYNSSVNALKAFIQSKPDFAKFIQ